MQPVTRQRKIGFLAALLCLLPCLAGAEELTESVSTIPVSPELAEKRAVEIKEAKISILPGEGYELSSIPVGNPRCLSCPDPKMGGRVRFWLVGIEGVNATHKRMTGLDTLDQEQIGGAAYAGVFYMRRIKHGYYEFRNVLGLEYVNMNANSEVETRRAPYGLRADADNGIYYSTNGNHDINESPFTAIFGGKVVGQFNNRGDAARVQLGTGALQLSAGIMLNARTSGGRPAILKASADFDLLRTTTLMLEEAEQSLEPSDAKQQHWLDGPATGFGGQLGVVTEGISVIVKLSKTNHGGPFKETMWRASGEALLHFFDLAEKSDAEPSRADLFKHGIFFNLGFDLAKYKREEEAQYHYRYDALDMTTRFGVGFKN